MVTENRFDLKIKTTPVVDIVQGEAVWTNRAVDGSVSVDVVGNRRGQILRNYHVGGYGNLREYQGSQKKVSFKIEKMIPTC